MSLVTTGGLELAWDDKGKVENVQTGGEIRYTITGGERASNDDWDHYRWTAKFRKNGRTMQITYRVGLGNVGVPKAEDVLEAAFSDADAYKNNASYYDFCDEYGYDPEEKKSARIYGACQRQHERLDRFFEERRGVWEEAVYYTV